GHAKVGELLVVPPEGPEVIVASGAVVSTVQVRVASVASVFPAWSVARTANVWVVSERLPYVWGELQAVKLPPSSLHSKLEPDSLEVKENVASVELVGPDGPELIVV